MVQNPPAADHHDAAGTGGGGSSSTGPTSWMGHKQRGRECYERGDYSQALASYRAALHPEYRCPDQERQILLSNVVACRLKLGGPAQAEAAVSDAKRCVRIDPNWAKGHVRLASAYIATDNPANSNDACNALQTALRLDPGNTLARQMLVRELRRDHRPASHSSRRDEPPPPAQNPNYVPPSSSSFPARGGGAASRSRTGGAGAGSSSASTSSSSWSTTAGPQPYEATAPPPAMAPQHEDHQPQQQQQPDPPDIDDQLSWFDRVRFYTSRVSVWYGNLSADTRTAIVVAAVVLILYASFAMDASSGGYYSSRSSGGGSGGNSGNQGRREGNYGAGNAYDQYRHRRYGGGSSSSYYRGYYGQNYRDRNNYGWSLSHVFDGGSGLQVMLLVLAVGYGCHLMGINPMHALLLLRIVGGGGRRRGVVFYGGGYGGGGGFYNVGVLRQRHHHHPARPRGWW